MSLGFHKDERLQAYPIINNQMKKVSGIIFFVRTINMKSNYCLVMLVTSVTKFYPIDFTNLLFRCCCIHVAFKKDITFQTSYMTTRIN